MNSGYKASIIYNKAVSVESKNDKQRKKCTYKNKKETLSGSTLPTMKKYRPT